MIRAWLHPVEQIIGSARANKARVLAFTSFDNDAGVKPLTEEIADVLNKSGVSTLLMRLGTNESTIGGTKSWTPASTDISQAITRHPKGFDVLSASTEPDDRFHYNNTDRLRVKLSNDLERYQSIVVELPVVQGDPSGCISAVSVAAACDAVYLVCLAGHTTRPQLSDAVKTLHQGGVQLAGTILNDAELITPAQSINAALQRLQHIAPNLSKRWQQKVAACDILN